MDSTSGADGGNGDDGGNDAASTKVPLVVGRGPESSTSSSSSSTIGSACGLWTIRLVFYHLF